MENMLSRAMNLTVGVTIVFGVPFVCGVASGIYAYKAGNKDGRKDAVNELRTIVETNIQTLKYTKDNPKE